MSAPPPSAPFEGKTAYVEAYAIPPAPGPSERNVHVSAVPLPAEQQNHDANIRAYLTENKWPVGLQDTFVNNLSKIPIRYFVVDDSGSMSTSDGKRLFEMPGGQMKMLPCSRWAELTATLAFHAGAARAAGAPTEFRLLNGASPIMIGDGTDHDDSRFHALKAIFAQSPGGATPLCRHIREVTEQIRRIAPGLRAAGQKACIVIATDGESSDGDIAAALRPLKELPAWVVIRLCTDEDRIVDYWNNIDNELELDMDVLDDLCGEAGEVHEKNPWLTYGDPMHKLREFGIPVKEIDLLDEASLTLEQIRLFSSFIFGGNAESFPHPALDYNAFRHSIDSACSKTPKTWCPIRKTMRPWVVTSYLPWPPGGACTTCSIS